MANKKKNANYATEKNAAAKLAKEDAARKKKIKKILIPVIAALVTVAVIVGLVFAIGIPFGMLDYKPEGTKDVLITFKDYGSIHVELYGNDAPKTVEHFLDSIEKLEGKPIWTYKDDLLYFGSSRFADNGTNGLKGEFSDNGVDNEISIRRGVIAAARGEDYNSGGSQYFIATKNSTDLNGKYAAFAKITSGMDVIEKILDDIEVDENGNIKNGPVIESISSHDSHDH